MDLVLPEEIAAQLENCEAVLASLEEKAKPFLNRNPKDIDAQLDPVGRAEVHLALAQTVTALLELYLKASGVAPEDQDTGKEKERLKAYDKKVRKVVAEKELSESRRSLEVNVAALNRVITHAVPDLSSGQKAALKQQGAASKKQAAPGGSGNEQQADAAGGSSRKRPRRDGGGRKDEALAFLQEAMAEIRGGGTGAAAGAGEGQQQRQEQE